jgi:hypothetical protein
MKSNDNEIKLEEPIKKDTIAQICANEVNEIMTKYNCYFATQTIFDNGKVFNNVIIKEKAE